MVVYYSSGNTDAANGLANAFGAKYGITVQRFFSGSIALGERVAAEKAANKLAADILDIDMPLQLGPVKNGWLITYDPPSRAPIPDIYKAPTWTEFRLYAGALGWNTKNVKADNAPKDWKDMADPKWRGRIALYDPATTFSGVAWFDMVQHIYGDAFLTALAANKPKIYPNGVPVAAALTAGEINLGSIYDYAIPQQKALGAPFDGILPNDTYVLGATMGIFAGSPHPNAAKLFYNFATSAEGDAAYCNPIKTIPANPNAFTNGAHKVSDIKRPYKFDFADLISRQAALVNAFAKLFKS